MIGGFNLRRREALLAFLRDRIDSRAIDHLGHEDIRVLEFWRAITETVPTAEEARQ